MTSFRPAGPRDAKIVIIGEAEGEQEEYAGAPFVGHSGNELTKMLAEAGIDRNKCYITNVLWERPPDNDLDYYFEDTKSRAKDLVANEGWKWINGKCCSPAIQSALWRLDAELSCLRPNVIIALGNTPLWATTGKWGITTWRSSEMESPYGKVVPTYHPASILRQWDWRATAVHDLGRANRESQYPEVRYAPWRFTVRPSSGQVFDTLGKILGTLDGGHLVHLSVDIETRAGHIACIGLAWSKLEAICIPFMCVERPEGYWTPAEEEAIVALLHRVLKHPNSFIIGQNHSYDLQYNRHHFLLDYPVAFDCMVAQAICFAGQPKTLDYQASMYNDHYCYWKDDGKEWNPAVPEEQLWSYNCEDCVRTFECYEVLNHLIDHFDLRWQFDWFMKERYPTYLGMMYRGILVDTNAQAEMATELLDGIAAREQYFIDLTGAPLNPRSPIQMKDLFIDRLGQKVRFNRKTKRPSLDDEALEDIGTKEPLLWPLIAAISEYRSLGVFLSTFVRMRLDIDGRARTNYSRITESYRATSSKNPFGRGGNMQNIPKGDRATTMVMPNVRRMFKPDPGFIIGEVDLKSADAQIVAWDADDPILKQMFRESVKIHAENAKMLFGGNAGPDGKREPYYTRAKVGVHATNYVCSARTLAAELGITVHEADEFQRRWFAIHPWIRAWHERIESELQANRQVRNKFGFRRYYFDRIESLLSEAVAWIPQSTVAHVCDRAMIATEHNLPAIQILLQVHDSFVFQCPVPLWPTVKQAMIPHLRVVVPYDDPLIIPFDLKTSTKSWGHAESESWAEVKELVKRVS